MAVRHKAPSSVELPRTAFPAAWLPCTRTDTQRREPIAHILIADDDEIIAELASHALIEAGHACGWVTDGLQALKLLEWRRPDLLLLEQDMPGMNCAQLLRELRNSSSYYDLPIVMLTAITGREDEEQALFAGTQDFVRKPFAPDRLVLSVNSVLRASAERPRHLELRTPLERSAGIRQDNGELRRSLA